MTNLEAAIAAIATQNVSTSLVEKALFDADINPSDVYDKVDKYKINLIAIEALKAMLSLKSISEGGYTIVFDIEGIKLRLGYLEQAGFIGVPTIKNAPFW